MTLIEILVSLFLFTMIAAGIMSSLVQSRRLAIAALYEMDSLIAAQGYMEQIKTINYADLLKSAKDYAGGPLNLATVTASSTDIDVSDPFQASTDATPIVNSRLVDVFGRYSGKPPVGATNVMSMTFVVKITNLSTGLDDNRVLVQLNYTWLVPRLFGAAYTRAGSLALIRSSLPSYVSN